jgi:hypothetical protein
MKMEQTECSEKWAYKIQDGGELPRRKHTEHGESLKSRIQITVFSKQSNLFLISLKNNM